MNKHFFVVLAALFVTACSSVDTASVREHKAAISKCMAENPDDKENCVSEESSNRVGLQCKNVTVTGSRLPERICTTQAQRDEKKKNAKMLVEGMQRRGQATNNQ